MCLGLVDPNKICPGLTFPQASFSTTCRGSFPSASWHQNLYRSRFPRPFLTCAAFPRALWIQTRFDLSLLSLSLVHQKLEGVRFPQPHGTNIYIEFVSLCLMPETGNYAYVLITSRRKSKWKLLKLDGVKICGWVSKSRVAQKPGCHQD